MTTVYLGLGSNVGDREGYLRRAVSALSHLEACGIRSLSSIYETEPWGNRQQGLFLNQVVAMDATLNPATLLEHCQAIERSLGRRSGGKRWGPRTVDIDMLLFGEEIVKNDVLQIPHPRLAERQFVLVPLHEIAPEIRVPGLEETVENLLRSCPDSGHVRLFKKID